MNTPTTAHEALYQCELLWKELARTGSDDKNKTAFKVLQYFPAASCPACEYDKINREFPCSSCPIDIWRRNTKGELAFACVITPKSPFNIWLEAHSPEDRKSAALGVLRLIRASEAYSNVP